MYVPLLCVVYVSVFHMLHEIRYRWLFGLLVKDHGGGGSDCGGSRRVGWSPNVVYDVAFCC
jgi:hypothetical protein